MRPVRIFCSYSRRDQMDSNKLLIDYLRRLVLDAEKMIDFRVDFFVDEKTPAAARWEEFIKHKVKEADLLLLALSSHSSRSEWCQRELSEFRQAQEERGIDPPPIFWIGLAQDSCKLAREMNLADQEMGVALLCADIKNHQVDSLEVGVKRLGELLRQTASAVIPRSTSFKWHPKPELEQYQFLGAFDSVRTQRGVTDQTEIVNLRAKLAYLLGYTIVVSESQAIDSLGTIRAVSEASRAWQTLRRLPDIPPFRIVYFQTPKDHVIDLAQAKLNERFESSAWRIHNRHREGGVTETTGVAEAKQWQEWEDFIQSARFLSWFPSDGVAGAPIERLRSRLERVCNICRNSRFAQTPFMKALSMLVEKKHDNRTSLYREIDEQEALFQEQPNQSRTLKDLVDIAYNRTVADGVLRGATANVFQRSMVLTNPSTDQTDPMLQFLVQSMVDTSIEEQAHTLSKYICQGAWERRQNSEKQFSELSWADIFSLTQETAWHEQRNKVIRLRKKPHTSEDEIRDARMNMADWLASQISGNFTMDPANSSFELHEGNVSAGIGRSEVLENGILAEEYGNE